MFVTKKKYEELAGKVHTLNSTLTGNVWGHPGVVQELRNKITYEQLVEVKSRLNSRIEELEDLLIKAGILVEVQETKADLTREEPDLDSTRFPFATKKVCYAVKKIK